MNVNPIDNIIKETREKYEFLTFLITKDTEEWRCGVVQNSNTRFITFYDIAKIRDEKLQKQFIELADKWWWESGQSLPIDCFIGPGFDVFQEALITIPKKTLSCDPIGPIYSITDQYLKRVKKRRVDLVNRRK